MDWKTVQFFLSSGKQPAVFEVDFNTVDSRLRCSCPGFRARKKCKHTTTVQKVLDDNNGDLPMRIYGRVTESEVREAENDPKAFRRVMVRHSEITVL